VTAAQGPVTRRLGDSARIGFLLAALIATSSACGIGAKRAILAEALDDRDDRAEYFEAILRILDENPEYVDQFFVQARDHEPTLDRFIRNAAHNLDEQALAEMTAKHLANNPEGLRKILIESLEAAKDKPEARKAIASAIGTKVDLSTDILTDDPNVVRETLLATVRHVAKKRESRRAFVQAMYGASPTLAGILANNPTLLAKMFDELTAQLKGRPEAVEKLLGEIVRDDGNEKEDEGERQPARGD
jgi:hypothetical protein